MPAEKKNKRDELNEFVKYQEFIFPDRSRESQKGSRKEAGQAGLKLENGAWLSEVKVRYECYGKLNQEKSNAILIIHALTGNHHAAGYYPNEKSPGWWNNFIGPGKAFDTNKYFVVCSNNLGGCSGTTGPNSIMPDKKRVYGLNFPQITLSDMVNVQHRLMEHLGIPFFHTIAGGSMGGMMALYWSVHFPECVKNVIAIATTAAQNSQSIAFSEVGRQAILKDKDFKEGYYTENDGGAIPKAGLSIARMLAHITYLSDESMRKKFGRERKKKNNQNPGFSAEVEFEIESYLRYQGAKFTDRFDANSYLYITKALNYFNLKDGFPSLEAAFRKSKAKYLVICFDSDWLYPSYMSRELVEAMLNAEREASFIEIESQAGHDAFLLEKDKLTAVIKPFLTGVS